MLIVIAIALRNIFACYKKNMKRRFIIKKTFFIIFSSLLFFWAFLLMILCEKNMIKIHEKQTMVDAESAVQYCR